MTRNSLSLLLVLLLVTVPSRAAILPDTGQTLCDNGSNVLSPPATKKAARRQSTGDNT